MEKKKLTEDVKDGWEMGELNLTEICGGCGVRLPEFVLYSHAANMSARPTCKSAAKIDSWMKIPPTILYGVR